MTFNASNIQMASAHFESIALCFADDDLKDNQYYQSSIQNSSYYFQTCSIYLHNQGVHWSELTQQQKNYFLKFLKIFQLYRNDPLFQKISLDGYFWEQVKIAQKKWVVIDRPLPIARPASEGKLAFHARLTSLGHKSLFLEWGEADECYWRCIINPHEKIGIKVPWEKIYRRTQQVYVNKEYLPLVDCVLITEKSADTFDARTIKYFSRFEPHFVVNPSVENKLRVEETPTNLSSLGGNESVSFLLNGSDLQIKIKTFDSRSFRISLPLSEKQGKFYHILILDSFQYDTTYSITTHCTQIKADFSKVNAIDHLIVPLDPLKKTNQGIEAHIKLLVNAITILDPKRITAYGYRSWNFANSTTPVLPYHLLKNSLTKLDVEKWRELQTRLENEGLEADFINWYFASLSFDSCEDQLKETTLKTECEHLMQKWLELKGVSIAQRLDPELSNLANHRISIKKELF